jgi:type III restriction enzyme
MKLKFNPSLDYQQDAIGSTLALFEGLPRTGDTYMERGIANDLDVMSIPHRDTLLENLQDIQERNYIEKSARLIADDDVYAFPNFSVEMETGTGKTYVYLRTLFDLHKQHGLRKFIIVVPSVAIREGVLSSIAMMKEHFRSLYDNVPFDYYLYNSKDLSKVRQFAVANTLQIMVINIQAFQKDAGDVEDYKQLSEAQRKKLNVIHQELDRMMGRPIEFIQQVKPVVIIDEPQSVDNTDKAKRAIRHLHPLFALRYSATHKNPYNVLYELGPVKAYDLKLVKQISVSSIQAQENVNSTFIKLSVIGYSGKALIPSASVKIYENTPNGTKQKSVKLKQGTDLSDHTNRDGYQGYVVDEIYAEPGAEYVRFANNVVLEIEQEKGGIQDDILKEQVRQTVEEHFKKERNLLKQGLPVKVLSLFFIDKVANYRFYDENGQAQQGKLAQWFEQTYNEVAASPLFKDLPKRDVALVHDGYFSTDKKRGKVVGLKDTTGTTNADAEVYALIMKDKERLLDDSEPLRFIFSHSALKEGWDNPNVFQICSLRDFGSERERRQTLGRGLRLAVDANGDRIYDPQVNRLTVVASESFESYAKQLQSEMEKDIGGGFKFGRVSSIAFAPLMAKTSEILGQKNSKALWQALYTQGYLDKQGDITNKFKPDDLYFSLSLPAEFQTLENEIIDKLRSFMFAGRVQDNRKRQSVSYNKRVELNPDFKILWNKISQKTKYSIEFSTQALIDSAVYLIQFMPVVKPVTLNIDHTQAKLTEAGFAADRQIQTTKARYIVSHELLPDLLSALQQQTELTRSSLLEILKRCGRLAEFKANPQGFITEVSIQIHNAMEKLLVDGIRYEKLAGQQFKMELFEEPELESYLDRVYQVQHAHESEHVQTPYDYIQYDSNIERLTAHALDGAENVKFFCKLPPWFKIPTPVGDYNPDWAVVLEDDKKVYLIRETKSTHDSSKRRLEENLKILCGEAHFKALDGIDYRVATSVAEVVAHK